MEEEECEVVEVTESLVEDQLGVQSQSGVSDQMQDASLEVGSHCGGVYCIYRGVDLGTPPCLKNAQIFFFLLCVK